MVELWHDGVVGSIPINSHGRTSHLVPVLGGYTVLRNSITAGVELMKSIDLMHHTMPPSSASADRVPRSGVA